MSTTTLTPTWDAPKLLKKGSTSELKSASTPPQRLFGCQHIKHLLQAARQQACDGYTRLIQKLGEDEGLSSKTHKSSNGIETSLRPTYLCLQCPNVNATRDRHRKDHAFSVESEKGFIYCHECRDFVYDATFEDIRSGSNSKKRKHSTLAPEDAKLVAANCTNVSCAATGLRGLYNMGQTCFMSVILQSLIHNPLIRSFYLGEGHKSSECEREACTACALDDIFTDFYGQDKHEGYGAVHMLQGCWKGGGVLAGYSQQDAHEYLNFLLNSLHTAMKEYEAAKEEEEEEEEEGSPAKKVKQEANGGEECDCVIHRSFSGLLKSTVICRKCNNVTTAIDPFMDLSLDIRSSTTITKKKKLPMTNGVATVKEVLPMDLTECLDRFTRIETLSADNYNCQKCGSNQEASKRLSLSRLPPVIPIHLKRFTHSKTLAQSTKVDTRIRYPLTLDLEPYIPGYSSEVRRRPKSELPIGHKAEGEDDPEADFVFTEPIYELSSVVVHKGKIDNGHYVNYSRQGEHEWYRFDDSIVVQVGEKEVLGVEAYMLFYVARAFEV